MIKTYKKYDNTVEIDGIKSDYYGATIAVVDIETFNQGRKIFPCGDGNDYKLNDYDVEKINNLLSNIEGK